MQLQFNIKLIQRRLKIENVYVYVLLEFFLVRVVKNKARVIIHILTVWVGQYREI